MEPYTEQQAELSGESVRAWEAVLQEMLNYQEVKAKCMYYY